jgi:hypothetical protein
VAEVAGLRQVEILLRDQLTDTKTDRRWRDQAEAAQRLADRPAPPVAVVAAAQGLNRRSRGGTA